jgi:hypothetical protein
MHTSAYNNDLTLQIMASMRPTGVKKEASVMEHNKEKAQVNIKRRSLPISPGLVVKRGSNMCRAGKHFGAGIGWRHFLVRSLQTSLQ